MRTISVDQYREFAERLFLNTGISESDAKLVTDTLLYASLRGHDSHGLGHIGTYVRGLMGLPGGFSFAGVNKSPNMRKVKESPATVAIDGDWAIGHKATQYATELVIEKAKKLGIGAASIYNTTHNGALGYYTLQMVEQGMIGMAFTNAGACAPPWGGTQRMLGTNPMSMAFPAGDEYPIMFDMATSSTVWLTIIPIVMSGGPLPEATLLNDDGELTTNRDEFTTVGVQGKPKGAMANMANNHKGYSIQLAVEMLAGILPALISGQQVTTEGHFHNPTLLIMLLNGNLPDKYRPNSVAPSETMTETLQAMKQATREFSRQADGSETTVETETTVIVKKGL